MVDKEIVARIAGKIRAIRLKTGLTIQQLAERADVSKGLLSKIENSRTIPSLPVFVRILRCLDISFMDFFSDMGLGDQKNYILIRMDKSAAVHSDESNNKADGSLLSPALFHRQRLKCHF